MAMRPSHMISKLALGSFLALSCALTAADAGANGPPREVTPSGTGFAGVYGIQPANNVETLATPDMIKSVAVSGAPTAIFGVLEHGEKVECLDCIPYVAPLLYDTRSAKTREIAAWWLRRRAFGVFGPGEVYEQTLGALASDPDPLRRSYAAEALGEFLFAPGVAACSQAMMSDGDARVRAASASALGRLNDDGAGLLGRAMADGDPSVRLAALGAASKINAFSSLPAVAALSSDSVPEVRRRAMEVLDGLNAKDTVTVVAAAAKGDSDAGVRAAACHALGTFGDPSVVSLLTTLSQSDPDTFVRDQASIALKRI
jgi:HEAT repeat protein